MDNIREELKYKAQNVKLLALIQLYTFLFHSQPEMNMIEEEIKLAKQQNAFVNTKVVDVNNDIGPTLYSDTLDEEVKSEKLIKDDIPYEAEKTMLEKNIDKNESAWRAERKQIDDERIQRQKGDKGWTREWDADKVSSQEETNTKMWSKNHKEENFGKRELFSRSYRQYIRKNFQEDNWDVNVTYRGNGLCEHRYGPKHFFSFESRNPVYKDYVLRLNEIGKETVWNRNFMPLPKLNIPQNQKPSNTKSVSKIDKQVSPVSKIDKQVSPVSKIDKQASSVSKIDKQASSVSKIDKQVSPVSNSANKSSQLKKVTWENDDGFNDETKFNLKDMQNLVINVKNDTFEKRTIKVTDERKLLTNTKKENTRFDEKNSKNIIDCVAKTLKKTSPVLHTDKKMTDVLTGIIKKSSKLNSSNSRSVYTETEETILPKYDSSTNTERQKRNTNLNQVSPKKEGINEVDADDEEWEDISDEEWKDLSDEEDE
ncbi:hypothetical protein PGB90_008451 [Kerria lacca]